MRNHAQLLLGAVLASCLHVSTADAQATRTWVSGVGDDANPCSRTAPCKTFPGAISKTAAGGEINCLDPGGFGGVTITKSITIDCTGTFGSTLVSGTNGVVVNGANVIVTLRGIAINGVGTGLSGIRFLQGAALHVQNVTVFGFRTTTGKGLEFAPSNAGAELHVTDSAFLDNGTGQGGFGIVIIPTGSGNANAVLNRVQLINNNGNLNVNSSNGGQINVTLKDSVVSNGVGGIGSVSAGANLRLMIDRTIVSNNVVGVASNGAATTVFLGNSVVSGNTTGLTTVNSGNLLSFQNNLIGGNATDGNPSGTIAPK
jgi:hypothetical protein